MSALEFPVRHHATLERTVLLELKLTCRTGLHIGAGKSIALVGSDLPVMRDAEDRVLIPGSSLRGVLRSGIEALLRSLGLDTLKPRPAAEPACDAELARNWAELNLVERLFGRIAETSGGFSYGSRLQISDARCDEKVAVELRDGVAISRESRTAAGAAKFDLEVVPAGTEFRGRIRLTNPEDYEVGLVAQSLWMLDEGLLLLGGNTARGLGWMKAAVADPIDLTAEELVERKSSGNHHTFGGVEEKLGRYLASLQELVAQAAESS
ncbi:MAG: CRISPR-associated RAMP protein [bacterium]|nr:CRISPR-associated RAMP protein [bacterium]